MSENVLVRCKRCNKPLSVPNSIKHGLGPVCYVRIYGREMPRPEKKRRKEVDESLLTNALEYFR